jgi:hypothetical protein
MWIIVIWIIYFPAAIGAFGQASGIYGAMKLKSAFIVVYIIHFILVGVATITIASVTSVFEDNKDYLVPVMSIEAVIFTFALLTSFILLVNV